MKRCWWCKRSSESLELESVKTTNEELKRELTSCKDEMAKLDLREHLSRDKILALEKEIQTTKREQTEAELLYESLKIARRILEGETINQMGFSIERQKTLQEQILSQILFQARPSLPSGLLGGLFR